MVTMGQTQPARFMYNNSEIIKRTHAVGINVRVLLTVSSTHETLTTDPFGRMYETWFCILLLMLLHPVG